MHLQEQCCMLHAKGVSQLSRGLLHERLESRHAETYIYIYITRSSGPRFARPSLLLGHFWIFMALFGVRRGLKMILSHRARSSLNMSSYRAIWTHFRQNFIFFGQKISDCQTSKLFLKCKSPHLAILIII